MDRERIKLLIEFSSSVEEADQIITEAGFSSVKEKIAFLMGMFDFALIGRNDCDNVSAELAEEMDYYAILSAIINNKWEY